MNWRRIGNLKGPAGIGAAGNRGLDGSNGKSAYEIALEHNFSGSESDWLASLSGSDGKDGRDGKDADAQDIRAEVAKAIADIPLPRDGIDGSHGQAGKSAYGLAVENGFSGTELQWIASLQGKDGATGPMGPSGKDADPEVVAALVERTVAAAIEKIPAPRDGVDGAPGPMGPAGKDVDPDIVAALVDKKVAAAIEKIPAPKDGIDGAQGPVGPAGKDAEPIHPDTVARMVYEAVQKSVGEIPRAKDGRDGRDANELAILPSIEGAPIGAFVRHAGGVVRVTADGYVPLWNGIASESEVQLDGGRTIERTTTYTDGSTFVRKHKTHALIYRFIWDAATKYDRGDTVTLGGSTWHCNNDGVTSRPGEGSADWTLATKRGNHGKDGKGQPGQDADPKSIVEMVIAELRRMGIWSK